MAAIFVTLQVSSNATTHEIIASSCREDEKLSTAKSFRNTATYQKPQGSGFINPPPPPPAL